MQKPAVRAAHLDYIARSANALVQAGQQRLHKVDRRPEEQPSGARRQPTGEAFGPGPGPVAESRR
jgi:hypothetical protein